MSRACFLSFFLLSFLLSRFLYKFPAQVVSKRLYCFHEHTCTWKKLLMLNYNLYGTKIYVCIVCMYVCIENKLIKRENCQHKKIHTKSCAINAEDIHGVGVGESVVVVEDHDGADDAAGHHNHDAGEVGPDQGRLTAWRLKEKRACCNCRYNQNISRSKEQVFEASKPSIRMYKQSNLLRSLRALKSFFKALALSYSCAFPLIDFVRFSMQLFMSYVFKSKSIA